MHGGSDACIVSGDFFVKKSLSNSQVFKKAIFYPSHTEAPFLVTASENALQLFQFNEKDGTELVAALCADSTVRDLCHIKLEIAKSSEDCILYVTQTHVGLAVLKDKATLEQCAFRFDFGCVSFAEFWTICAMQLDAAARTIVFYSLWENVVFVKLKRKLESFEEFFAQMTAGVHVRLPKCAIWHALMLKSFRSLAVLFVFDEEQGAFFVRVCATNGTSDDCCVAQAPLPKEAGTCVHVVQGADTEESFFVLTDTCIVFYRISDDAGKPLLELAHMQRLKDYVAGCSSLMFGAYCHWKESMYFFSSTKGDLLLGTFKADEGLFKFRTLRKIEPSSQLCVACLAGRAVLLNFAEFGDGALLEIKEDGSVQPMKRFAYNMSPLWDVFATAPDQLLVSCGVGTQSSIRCIAKGRPAIVTAFSESLFSSATGLWALGVVNAAPLILFSFIGSSLAISWLNGAFEDVTPSIPIEAEAATVFAAAFGGKLFQVYNRGVKCIDAATFSVDFDAKFNEVIIMADVHASRCVLSSISNKIYVLDLGDGSIINYIECPVQLCLVKLDRVCADEIVCCAYDAVVYKGNAQGELRKVAENGALFSDMHFSGDTVLFGSRDGFIFQYTAMPDAYVLRGVAKVGGSPVFFCTLHSKAFALSDHVFEVIAGADAFFCVKINLELSVRCMCAFETADCEFAAISKTGSLSLFSVNHNRNYLVGKFEINKGIRRVHVDDAFKDAAIVFCNVLDGEGSELRAYDVAKYTEQLRHRLHRTFPAKITAFHSFVTPNGGKYLMFAYVTERTKTKISLRKVDEKGTASSLVSSATHSGSLSSVTSADNLPLLIDATEDDFEVDGNVLALDSFVYDGQLIMLFAQGRCLFAAAFDEEARRFFASAHIDEWQTKNLITCIEAHSTHKHVIFVGDSRDGVCALEWVGGASPFKFISCFLKIRFLCDMKWHDDGLLYCIDKLGFLTLLAFEEHAFKAMATFQLNEMPLRMCRLPTVPYPSSLLSQTADASIGQSEKDAGSNSRIVIGTISGNIWTAGRIPTALIEHAAASPTSPDVSSFVRRYLSCAFF